MPQPRRARPTPPSAVSRPSQKNGQQPAQGQSPPRRPPHLPAAPEVVDPRWILKALAAVMAVGLICAYGTLCIVFSHQQWQLVLHPSRTVKATPDSRGLPGTEVHFAADSSGQPQLDGWWIPSVLPPDALTVLILHGADGTLSDALPAARRFHDAGLNVFLFDPRGYGHSLGAHPDEETLQADAASALTYLTSTRRLAPSSLVIDGEGLGASLATALCAANANLAALILNAPDGDVQARIESDPRTRILPLRLLLKEHFALAEPLRSLSTPKLLITAADHASPALRQAADPKTLLFLPPGPTADAEYLRALNRFLSSYVAHDPKPLLPTANAD